MKANTFAAKSGLKRNTTPVIANNIPRISAKKTLAPVRFSSLKKATINIIPRTRTTIPNIIARVRNVARGLLREKIPPIMSTKPTRREIQSNFFASAMLSTTFTR